jgi:hypothetical protein
MTFGGCFDLRLISRFEPTALPRSAWVTGTQQLQWSAIMPQNRVRLILGLGIRADRLAI